MAPRLSGQTSKIGVVFFVSKSLLGAGRQNRLKNYKSHPKASEPCKDIDISDVAYLKTEVSH